MCSWGLVWVQWARIGLQNWKEVDPQASVVWVRWGLILKFQIEIYKITYFEFEKEQFNFKLKIVFPKQFFVKCLSNVLKNIMVFLKFQLIATWNTRE